MGTVLEGQLYSTLKGPWWYLFSQRESLKVYFRKAFCHPSSWALKLILGFISRIEQTFSSEIPLVYTQKLLVWADGPRDIGSNLLPWADAHWISSSAVLMAYLPSWSWSQVIVIPSTYPQAPTVISPKYLICTKLYRTKTEYLCISVGDNVLFSIKGLFCFP